MLGQCFDVNSRAPRLFMSTPRTLPKILKPSSSTPEDTLAFIKTVWRTIIPSERRVPSKIVAGASGEMCRKQILNKSGGGGGSRPLRQILFVPGKALLDTLWCFHQKMRNSASQKSSVIKSLGIPSWRKCLEWERSFKICQKTHETLDWF